MPDSLRWYVLRSQPKHEHIAAAHLRLMEGVEVFCSRLRFKRATVRGAKWFTEAMFPGYVFARFDLPTHHRRVRSAQGIIGIVEFGGRYPYIDNEIITGLRRQTDGQEVVEVQPELSEGASVRIVQGALCGLEAVITQILPGRERVRVLLNFLGREIHAEVANPDVLPPKRHPLAK